MKKLATIVVPVLALALGSTSCTTFAVPTHGGGKRWYVEQRILSDAAEQALDGIELGSVPTDGYVRLHVLAMGDEGGGVDVGSSPLESFGIVGDSTDNAAGAVTYDSSADPTASLSSAFVNARDLEYVKGAAILALAEKGVFLQDAPLVKNPDSAFGDNYVGDVYLLLSEFGTMKTNLNVWIYKRTKLAAGVECQAFFLPYAPDAGGAARMVSLGRGAATAEYTAQFILGFGPLNGGMVTAQTGPAPPRTLRADY